MPWSDAFAWTAAVDVEELSDKTDANLLAKTTFPHVTEAYRGQTEGCLLVETLPEVFNKEENRDRPLCTLEREPLQEQCSS